jgi:hypothetical protein
MKVIKIKGGIGNQLFQYAFATSLLNLHKIDIQINLEFYESKMIVFREPINLYSNLDIFEQFEEIHINLVSRIYKKLRFNRFHYLIYNLNARFGNFIIEDTQLGYRHIFLGRELDNIFFDGYFSDFRYIVNGLDTVKCAFEKLTINKSLDSSNFIAVHIRRGDYGNIMRDRDKSNILNVLYYKKSLDQLIKATNIDGIRVFSDDYLWAKSELPLIFTNCKLDFGPEVLSDIDSLWVMSKHEYLIGANSTFSLWAYYFGLKHIKLAIFPKEWVNSIEVKGYQLFSSEFSNINLINEE